MNAVVKRVSFAEGNFVTASAQGNSNFPEFIATSRLIEKIKIGSEEALLLTAIERVKDNPLREIYISIPATLAPQTYNVQNNPLVSFGLKIDDKIYESVAGEITLNPPLDDKNMAGSFKVEVEVPDSDGKTFVVKGNFQVLKA
ncbi:hypothetical protein EAH72_04135 [Pseudomonas caspiana]|nr:hypothetical protein [Pseudomonas caspiana]TPG98131.1 hypothetical protein EAH72_04135 [Pseudomonas caspiana]